MSGRGGIVIAAVVAAIGLMVVLVMAAGAGWFALSGGQTVATAPLGGGGEGLDGLGGADQPAAAGEDAPESLPDAPRGAGEAAGGAGAVAADGSGSGTSAPAAGVVQAVVTSKRTEAPLAGAVLTLQPAGDDEAGTPYTSEATTDDGRVLLSGIAAGNYTLRVERTGCEPVEMPGFAMSTDAGRDLGTVALVPTPAITGTVTRLDGTPAQGATVELVNEVALEFGPEMSVMQVIADLKAEEINYATVNADAKGRYTIWWDQALPGDYAMRAGAKESATAHAGVTLTEHATTERDFSLGTPVVLAGTVNDADGEPCAGCRLIAVPQPNDQMMMRARKMMIFKNIGTVNAAGAFRFDQLTAGSYMLFAGGNGYTQKMINAVTVPNEAFEIQLERGITLRGRVTDERTGEPIAGARVAVGGDGGFDVGRTDAEGKYEFSGIANRGLDFFVEAQGYPPVQRNVPRDSERSVIEFDVKLKSGLVLEGRVVSAADGRGVPHAKVLVLTETAGFTPGGVPRADADAEGRFAVQGVSLDPQGMGRVEVRVDEHGRQTQQPRKIGLRIVVVAAGYAQGELYTVQIAVGEQPPPFEVPMLPAARVTGRVLDGAGQPVAGATVDWTQRKPADVADDPAKAMEQMNTSMMLQMMLPDRAVKTGADGTFVLTEVRPGAETQITAKHLKHASVSSEPFASEGGKTVEAIELKLLSGATLVVVAKGPGGKPAVGQQIQIEPDLSQADLASGKFNPMELAGMEQFQPKASNPEGRVVLKGFAKGKYKVRCRGPMVSTKAVTVELDGHGETTVELELVQALSIEGVVRDHLGGAPKDAWIWAQRINGGEAGESAGSQQIEADGTFTLSGLAPGTYRLQAWGGGGTGQADPIEVQAGQRGVTIQFKAPPGEGK